MSSPPQPHQPLLPSLPDDLSVLILARLPISSHSTLALVSRSWRSILLSPHLFALRSHQLRLSEPFLCLNLRTPAAQSQSQWFLLDPLLRRRRTLPSPPRHTVGAAAAALFGSLFLLGGSNHCVPSSAVQILDPLRGIWAPGPRMSVAREFAAAASVNGRLYVLGGCLPMSEAWAEVLDGNTWDRVESPFSMREKWMHGSAVLGGRLFAVADRGGVALDTSRAGWEAVPKALDLGWKGRAAVVGGLLYSYDYLGKIKAYDPQENKWLPVEGLERELPKFLFGATLADFSGLLCLVWEGRDNSGKSKEMQILCAGIRIERSNGGGLRGSIVWPKSVLLTAPEGSSIAHCISLEL